MKNVEIASGTDSAQIAAFIHRVLAQKLAAQAGNVAISVPGGSTPFPILEELIQTDLDWSRIAVWPGDDRVVPEHHAASNTGKIRALLEPVGAQIVSLENAPPPPHFALVWLGMGADGHIASLFPNTDPQADDPQMLRRLTPDPLPPEAPFDRITLTIPALIAADQLMFVIRGEDKLAVFEAAMRGAHDLPVSRLLAAAADIPVTCFT